MLSGQENGSWKTAFFFFVSWPSVFGIYADCQADVAHQLPSHQPGIV